MKGTSLQHWAVGGFLFATLSVLGLGSVAWNFNQQTLQAAAFVGHSHEVIGAIKGVESNLYRAEAGQRGYLASGAPAFLVERDSALAQLDLGLAELGRLTLDNTLQQERLVELRRELQVRIEAYRTSRPGQGAGTLVQTLDERLADGVRVLARIAPRLQLLMAEEQRLLVDREAVERQRSQVAAFSFSALMLALMLVLPLALWRVRREWAARGLAEAQVGEERRYDDIHARALTLYNAESTRAAVLEGTLALLDESGRFPAAVFYAHEELGGVLRLEASRSAPADVVPTLRLQDGAIGSAARSQKPVYIEGLAAGTGLRIETGLATLRPAALLMSPVLHQGRVSGVLGLACSTALAERDRGFVERLCAQLGVALHNLGQIGELSLLAEQLRLRGEDVQRKNAELEKANRLKSEFLANMSHELRTPLNAVIGFSELMKDGLTGPLTAEQTEYVGDIHASGSHLLALINDILDLSKVESGSMTIDLEPVQPQQLATASIPVLRDRAADARIALSVSADAAPGRLLADLRKTRQIIYNLLSNAIKFTPEGGRVELALARVARAELAARGTGAATRLFAPADTQAEFFLQIRVTDSGIGIAANDLEQLFQPFVQIDSTLTRRYEGTGLGLSLVRRLAELQGGGLRVDSEPGRGSVFTVWLPWRAAGSLPDVPPSAPPAAPADAPDAAPRVLVIEDDPRAAKALCLQLQSQGYRVEVARDAEDGLRRIHLAPPAVLVLDIVLPGMDGWELLAELKRSPQTQHVPVVVVSVTDEARRGFTLGAAQVLCKPVTQEALLHAVAAAGAGAAAAGARVLVVDDDPKAVALVGKHLSSAGLVPLPAYSGREAIDLAQRELPDLVILDLMMPEVSGYDVLRELRAQPLTAGVPVIVLTAQLLDAQDRRRLHGQVLRVIEKSAFEPTSLLAEIRRVLAPRA